MAFPTGWGRKCALTIDADEVDAALTDFPVLFTEDNLPGEMFDADGSNPALSDGGDIRFSSDADGNTQLACEIVEFTTDNNPANGSAEIWVKVPSVSSSSDTTIYVWYSKSGESQPAVTDTYGRNNVWDSDYLGVYHAQNESSGATCVDSTGNGNTGTVDCDDGPQTGPWGNSSGAWGLDGVFDEVPLSAVLDDLTAFTIESWSYLNSATIVDDNIWYESAGVLLRYDAAGAFGGQNNVFRLALDNDTTGQQNYETSANSAQAQTWQHLAATWSDGNAPEVFIDGVSDTFSSSDGAASGNLDATDNFDWGSDNNSSIDGRLDECRISTIVRSDAWIAAGHSNQSAPGTFAAAGTPEDAAGGGGATPIAVLKRARWGDRPHLRL